MQGDFSRDTFDRLRHFRRVLMQQGRVTLDADYNEQVAILLHYVESLAADLLGPYAAAGSAFEIAAGSDKDGDLTIAEGRMYVDGILCENEAGALLSNQKYAGGSANDDVYPFGKLQLTADGSFWVYLDVWERHINSVEDDRIMEVALGGPDTCSRAEVVWQVKVEPEEGTTLEEFLRMWQPAHRGMLEAAARDDDPNDDPCNVKPNSQYRGAENQLYRIEVHSGSDNTGGPTFKWSRDNASIVFPVRTFSGDGAELEHLGRDERSTLVHGDWVEFVDDNLSLQDRRVDPLPLLRVKSVDSSSMEVLFEKGIAYPFDADKHPYLRRWDHGRRNGRAYIGAAQDDGAIAIEEGTDKAPKWIVLEDGIRIAFRAAELEPASSYRRRDYWNVTARVATGDIEWPAGQALGPHGVDHHFAPLAKAVVNKGALKSVDSLRTVIVPPIAGT